LDAPSVKTVSREADLVWVRRILSGAASVVFAMLAAGEFFRGTLGWGQLIALVALLGSVVTLMPRRTAPGRLADFDRVSYAMLVIAGVHGFAQALGPPVGGHVHALVYLVVAVAVFRLARHIGLLVVGVAIGLEVLCWDTFGGALAAIAVVGAVAGVAWLLRRQRPAVAGARATPAAPAEEEFPAALADESIALHSAASVSDSVRAALRLLHTGLGCHTAALLWLDPEGTRLVMRDAVSLSDALVRTVHPGEGALAGVLRRRESVILESLRATYRGLTYYEGAAPGPVRQFLGVPVIESNDEDGALLGVICLDRTGAEPFDDAARGLAEDAAGSIVRAVAADRLLNRLDKSRRELDRFYEASRELNSALKPADVYKVALECVGDIVPFDLACVVLTSYQDGRRVHRVERVVTQDDNSPWAADLSGLVFAHNAGLVSMAIEMRHPLPWGGVFDPSRNVAFTRKARVAGIHSLLVLPLVAQEREVGAFVVGSTARGGFAKEQRELLEVVANQVAVSLANARLYLEMEEMATIDGLTGLSNRRTFTQTLPEVIARSERVGTPFSLIITDIDHFKSVNDTYGHPMGDEVLRQVSATFASNLRQTDLPARYGGEEFAVILEGTDLQGAQQIAEKLRKMVESLSFDSPQGRFGVAMSFGIAEFPADAEDPNHLIERADQALYYAKTHGRNQVRIWRDIRRELQLAAAEEPVRTVA
jgi:two-component system, cell cycle response regulator